MDVCFITFEMKRHAVTEIEKCKIVLKLRCSRGFYKTLCFITFFSGVLVSSPL